MLEAQRSNSPASLVDVIDRILDKGLIINADITVSIAGIELLGISLRASVASFETAAKYGLSFPAGTDFNKPAWDNAIVEKETCPQCGKTVPVEELLNESCPWCGWVSAKANGRNMLDDGSRA